MDALLRDLQLALEGRYRLERELGHGGMATVYLAWDAKHDRKVALKVLRPEVAASFGPDRFLREIQIAARLSHPHILPLHDSGRAGPCVYYVMPFVPGESLRARIHREQQLPIEDALRIAAEVAGALGYAHSHDIVHRDIKPENILFQGGHAVVVDFGIGRAITAAESENITQPGLSIGTPGYMSPEQTASDHRLDGRSDIYSLGCVLYEMLTGHRPDPPSLRRSSGGGDPLTAPRQLREAIPEWVDHAVMRALARLAADRFATAGQFATALTTPATGLQRISAPGPHGGPTSIVVLPFANMSPDADAEYFSDGITEEIINALTRVQSLRVASRTSAFAFKGKTQDVRAIGAQMNASAVLEGSVRKAGNRLRITAQLVNTADGYHLWGERFDREMSDVFAVQDEISRAIVSTLKVKLRDSRTLVRPQTDDIEAYSLYLKGRYYWNKRYEVGLHRGLEFFQAAIAKDPGYALAHAGIADSFSVLGFYGYLAPRAAFTKAREAADRVMALDPELAEAHFSKGMVAFWHDWNWDEAEAAFRAALDRKPQQAEAHIFLSQLYAMQARFPEAIAEGRMAQTLDPVSPLVNAMAAWPYYVAGQHQEALEQCRKALEIDPGFPVALWIRALAHVELGEFDEAIAAAQKGVDLSQRSTFLVSTLGCALARAGRREEAEQALRELTERGATGYVAPFHFAVVHASLGQNELALGELDRSYLDRTPNLVTLTTLPLLSRIQDEPRAIALRHKMDLV
ncbi:MAG TPA: protein kinase [Gemmatimonadales bacterium]|nr:protein kinase [Gemmatimonadales bacterium]